MPVPETTSAENLIHYVGGKCLATGRGEAWREIKASVIALPSVVDALHMPSVSEPVLVWITSGDLEVRERENDGPWLTNRVKKGAFLLTTGGSSYDCRCKTLSAEPYESPEFADGAVARRADTAEGKPPFCARHRSGNRHPFSS